MLKSILEKGSGSIWIIWKGLGVTDVLLNAHSALMTEALHFCIGIDHFMTMGHITIVTIVTILPCNLPFQDIYFLWHAR